MKNQSILTMALCASGLLLASCGGSSSSDSPPLSDTPDEQLPDDVGMGGDEDMETDPDMETEQEMDPNTSASSILCASNTPTSTSVIGNNLFVFEAATGQCFGRAEEAANLDKRLVPLTVTQDVNDGIGEPLLTVPTQARVVLGRAASVLEPDNLIATDTFIVDITNTHSSTVCVEDDGLDILDATGQVVDDFISLSVAGDQYQMLPRRFDNCIPAGESRLMYGDYFSSTDRIEGGVLPNYDSMALRLDVDVLDATFERVEPLAPGEMLWTALPAEDGGFPYRASATVQNLTSESSTVSGGADLLFLDNDGFLLHVDNLGIDHFLGVDAVTDEDRILSASGGMIGFATWDAVSSLTDNGTIFRGPASRALLHFSRCVGSDC